MNFNQLYFYINFYKYINNKLFNMAQAQVNNMLGAILETAVNEQVSLEFTELLSNIPHTIPDIIGIYDRLTNIERKALILKIRGEGADIKWLLEFYLHNIYPGDYSFDIKHALESLSKHPNRSTIIDKLLLGMNLTDEEELVIDNGRHSGCSFMGLRYWLGVIFKKMEGNSYDNYHLVFDEGERQRIVKLF